jgi:hypothetical protein
MTAEFFPHNKDAWLFGFDGPAMSRKEKKELRKLHGIIGSYIDSYMPGTTRKESREFMIQLKTPFAIEPAPIWLAKLLEVQEPNAQIIARLSTDEFGHHIALETHSAHGKMRHVEVTTNAGFLFQRIAIEGSDIQNPRITGKDDDTGAYIASVAIKALELGPVTPKMQIARDIATCISRQAAEYYTPSITG